MSRKLDLIGRKFGKLTAVKEIGKNNKNELIWLFNCDCGNETEAVGYKVSKGYKKSCGCIQKEVTSKRATKHGMYGTVLHKKWLKMKERCDNLNSKDYPNYGGRGITYCPEWGEFQPFYEWAINNGYIEGLTIDRVEVDGNYEPSNCRWADIKTQNNNRRTNVYATINGETKTLTEWSEDAGINASTLYWRYRRGIRGNALIDKKDRRKRNLIV